MPQLSALAFEMPRRPVRFFKDTILPNGNPMNFDKNPNDAVQGDSDGDDLIYNSPVGTFFQMDDGTYYYKTATPNTWVEIGDGVASSIQLWEPNKEYKINDIFIHEDDLYQVVMNHTSDNDFNEDLNAARIKLIGSGSGAGVNGSAFITNIVPQDAGDSVSNKNFSSNGEVLDGCITNTEEIIVHVKAASGHTNYYPEILVDGNPVTLNKINDFAFEGSINVTLDFTDLQPIIVTHEDGAEHQCVLGIDPVPEILTTEFTGGYPGTQTELKEDDNFDLLIGTDIDVVGIEIDDFGALKSATHTVAAGANHTVTGVIANRGNTAQLLGARIRVKTVTDSWSDWYLTEDFGAVDGVNLVNLNNLHPTIDVRGIDYPPTQQALKNNEIAVIENDIQDYDTVEYLSPNGELQFQNIDVYELNKDAERIFGGYNISNNNYRIIAKREANDSTTTHNGVVWIADDFPVININVPHSRLRSGGNDGTAAQNYTVTINANQRLIEAPSLDAPEGTWQGVEFGGSNNTWTRSLQIHDDDEKGDFDFNNLVAFNLARREQNSIGSGETYTLGGFVSRDVVLLAFSYETQINVKAIDYNKVSLVWSFNPFVTTRAALDSMPPVFESWCLVALDTKPTGVRILDNSYTASSSPTIVTVEEAI